MPQFSVIVPIYKVEPYLRRCVDSILAQTFKDFELILVDDGSPDNCPAICDEYAAQDARVKVIHKPNGGLSDARNAGLDVATGHYVVFIDSDDYVAPTLLSSIMDAFDTDTDRVTFNYYSCGKTTEKQPGFPNNNVTYNTPAPADRFSFIHNVMFRHTVGWSAWSSVYKRELIERYHIRFVDTKKIFAEDLLFNMCYCICENGVKYLNEPLYYYVVQRDGSIMSADHAKINVNRMNELGKELQSFIAQSADEAYWNDVFPLLYFQIMDGNIQTYLMQHKTELFTIRRTVLANLQDKDFFLANMRSVACIKKKSQLTQMPGMRYSGNAAGYYASGNVFSFVLMSAGLFIKWMKKKIGK